MTIPILTIAYLEYQEMAVTTDARSGQGIRICDYSYKLVGVENRTFTKWMVLCWIV